MVETVPIFGSLVFFNYSCTIDMSVYVQTCFKTIVHNLLFRISFFYNLFLIK
jgi:hypothetical protein